VIIVRVAETIGRRNHVEVARTITIVRTRSAVARVVINAVVPCCDFLVITGTHNRTPAGVAAAVAKIVLDRAGAVMGQIERVSHFMARGFGYPVQALVEYKCRLQVARTKTSDVGESPTIAAGERVLRDDHADSPLGVVAITLDQSVHAGSMVVTLRSNGA